MGRPDLGLQTHAGGSVGHVRLAGDGASFLALLLQQLVLSDQGAVNGIGPHDGLARRVQRRSADRGGAQWLGTRSVLAVAAPTSSNARVLASHVRHLVVSHQRVHLCLIMVQFLPQVHGLHRLAIVFKAHASKRSLPVFLLLLVSLLVVLEELWLSAQVQWGFLLARHVMALEGLVDLVVAAGVLTFQAHSVVACVMSLAVLLRRHLVQVVGEALVVEVDQVVHVAAALIHADGGAGCLASRIRVQSLVLIRNTADLVRRLGRVLEEDHLAVGVVPVRRLLNIF